MPRESRPRRFASLEGPRRVVGLRRALIESRHGQVEPPQRGRFQPDRVVEIALRLLVLLERDPHPCPRIEQVAGQADLARRASHQFECPIRAFAARLPESTRRLLSATTFRGSAASTFSYSSAALGEVLPQREELRAVHEQHRRVRLFLSGTHRSSRARWPPADRRLHRRGPRPAPQRPGRAPGRTCRAAPSARTHRSPGRRAPVPRRCR